MFRETSRQQPWFDRHALYYCKSRLYVGVQVCCERELRGRGAESFDRFFRCGVGTLVLAGSIVFKQEEEDEAQLKSLCGEMINRLMGILMLLD